jgi:hypothetical protein
MKRLTLKRIMPAMFILISFTSYASDLGALPKKLIFNSPAFIDIVRTYEKNFNNDLVAKVCACQLLTVKTGNREIENVAVFSEKINNGDLSADFAVATQVLENERKHMKLFFYDKIKVVGKQVVATDCKTFYKQLKVKYSDLKMYEVLDADVISRFNNFN